MSYSDLDIMVDAYAGGWMYVGRHGEVGPRLMKVLIASVVDSIYAPQSR